LKQKIKNLTFFLEFFPIPADEYFNGGLAVSSTIKKLIIFVIGFFLIKISVADQNAHANKKSLVHGGPKTNFYKPY